LPAVTNDHSVVLLEIVRQPASATENDREVFERVYPALRRFASGVRPAGVDPDDLVQEALARTLAARSLASLDDPLAYLRTTVVRVAMNHTREHHRRLARVVRLGPPTEQVDDHYPSDLTELLRIAPRARAVLFLTVVEGCSYRETAEVVGCSEPAARAMASRALHRLRALLSQAESELGETS
jgi:RNA polymerase sigma-70 factor (ECF subfamily)